MFLCDISVYDSRLANVRRVVSRSSNKLFSEQDFTVSQGAGAGTCYWNTGVFSLFILVLDDGIEKFENSEIKTLHISYNRQLQNKE